MNWRPYALIVFVFIASRLWLWSIGVEYDTYRNTPETTVHIMQMLPTEAMEENVWETIWYDHIQPPIYSLTMYATRMDGMIVGILWSLMGAASTIALYALMVGLTSSSRFSICLGFLVSVVWACGPSSFLYGSTIIYTYPVACLLIIAAWALQRGHLVTFAVVCAMVTMTRSLFHFGAWLIPVLIIGWLSNGRKYRGTQKKA